jgi:hypothetical protein
MNRRYRKTMRLRSRHYRRGHTPWCNCPEVWHAFWMGWKHSREAGWPPPIRKMPPRLQTCEED